MLLIMGTCALFRTHSISEVRFFRKTNYDVRLGYKVMLCPLTHCFVVGSDPLSWRNIIASFSVFGKSQIFISKSHVQTLSSITIRSKLIEFCLCGYEIGLSQQNSWMCSELNQ